MTDPVPIACAFGGILPLAGASIAPGSKMLSGTENPNPSKKSATQEHLAQTRRRTEDEIRTLVAEYHARLPRDQAIALGAAYARYSSRFQDSIVDQIRTLLDDALRKKVFIPFEYIFIDLGVRGAKSDRPGLNGLRECLAAKAVQLVFFFATNRLFRKTYRSLEFVVEQIVERGIRAVFVKSGVDTEDSKRWQTLLNMHAMMDEFVIGMNVEHIRAAHEGLLEKSLVFGTVGFGYIGNPLPGQTTRRGKPRMALAIDPISGQWVIKVYDWYVVDRVSLDEIVRRLNSDPAVPPPPKSPKGVWTHDSVRALLRNTRYRGFWRYGVTESCWVSSKDYSRQKRREEPLKEIQLEQLRLVADDQWFAAQVLLDKEASKLVGRKARNGYTASRPRVLNGLFYCPTHNRMLYVGGPNGIYMKCKDCRGEAADRRPLYSHLPRSLALRKTCESLAGLIRSDSDLVRRVNDALRDYVAGQQAPDPGQVASLEGILKKRDRQIQYILRNPGDTDADQAESEAELRRLRKERSEYQTMLDALRAMAAKAIVVPTDDEVTTMINELPEILEAAAVNPAHGSAGLVRDLIDRLTGGRINLEQAGEQRSHGGWLRGRFRFRLVEALTARLTGVGVLEAEGERDVVIDYRPDPVVLPAATIAEVVRLYQEGILVKEIGRRLGKNRNTVAQILDDWHAQRGLERPDGRTRRSGLKVKHLTTPEYQSIADDVAERTNRGDLFGEIAQDLRVCIETVGAAWVFWHESRGLTAPDGRTRRKSLLRKSSTKRLN